MSLQIIKDAITNKKMICPKCGKPIQKFDKFADTLDRHRDGFNVVQSDSGASRVTLTCGNDGCPWTERTEYWENYITE